MSTIDTQQNLGTDKPLHPETTLLRIATAGSVDDGKSTLVGRLLHDTKNIFVDQLESIEHASVAKGLTATDLALLTDGLRAEREQGITIDVAYRYFATPKRSFILADCPGHVQYTRNAVTGASTADALIVLVDVVNGIVEQTRRHLAVAALLGVPHLIVAVNKIDLVDDAELRFLTLSDELRSLAAQLGIDDLQVIPVSALRGDNVVDRSEHTGWYDGPSLLELLTCLPDGIGSDNCGGFALPVQYVLRPQRGAVDPRLVDYRGYAGLVASGEVRPGDRVLVHPGSRETRVVSVDADGGGLDVGVAGQSIALRLADELDIARGDLITSTEGAPSPVRELEGVVCWLDDQPLRHGQRLLLKHTTRTVRVIVESIDSRLDLDSLSSEGVDSLSLNDIGRVRLRLAEPIFATGFRTSRSLGSFLLIDPHTAHTAAAGMVQDDESEPSGLLPRISEDDDGWNF